MHGTPILVKHQYPPIIFSFDCFLSCKPNILTTNQTLITHKNLLNYNNKNKNINKFSSVSCHCENLPAHYPVSEV